MKVTVAAVLLGAASLANAAAIGNPDFWSDITKSFNGNGAGNLADNGSGNKVDIAGILAGNGVGNGNGNVFKDNDVLSGNGFFSGNSASADGNSADGNSISIFGHKMSRRDFWSEISKAFNGNGAGNLADNASGNKFDIGAILSGNGNKNGNGNAALNDNGNGNVFKGNDVLSGNGFFSGNSASADHNSADDNSFSIGRRDVVWLPPTTEADFNKAFNNNGGDNAADNGSSNNVDISKILSGNGNSNGNGNTALSGNGNDNIFKGNNVLSGNGFFSGNSASVSGNSADNNKIYILPITVNQCKE